MTAYIVRWCGHDGYQQELVFKTYEAAKIEAAALTSDFDGVEIVSQDGKRIFPKEVS